MADELAGGIRLAPRAEADLEDIWRDVAATWTADQADRYMDGLVALLDLLRAVPGMTPERPEVTPPVRIHPTGPHLVLYRNPGQHLDVLRVLGGRQTWQLILEALE